MGANRGRIWIWVKREIGIEESACGFLIAQPLLVNMLVSVVFKRDDRSRTIRNSRRR